MRATDDVDQDVEGCRAGTDLVEDGLRAAGGADVGGDEQVRVQLVVGFGAGGGHHGGAGLAQPGHDGGALALGCRRSPGPAAR